MQCRHLAAVIWLGCAFLVLFAGFNTLQLLLPARRPRAGALLISLTYVFYALGSLLAPRTRTALGRRFALSVSACSFPLWIIALRLDSDLWLGLASLGVGAGSGVLWAVQGAWIAELCQEDKHHSGLYAGLFMVLYSLGTAFGQILNLALLLNESISSDSGSGSRGESGLRLEQSYTDLALLLGSLGVFALACAPPRFLASRGTLEAPPVQTPVQTPIQSLSLGRSKCSPMDRWRRLFRSEWTLLIPSFLVLAFATSYLWVAVPILVERERLLGWSFVAYAGVSVLAFFLLGLLLDVFRSRTLRIWLLTSAGLALNFAAGLLDWQSLYFPLDFIAPFSVAFLALLGAAANNVVTVVQARDLDPSLAADGFAFQHFIYCLAYALCSASLGLFGVTPVVWAALATLLLSCFCLAKLPDSPARDDDSGEVSPVELEMEPPLMMNT